MKTADINSVVFLFGVHFNHRRGNYYGPQLISTNL